MHLDDGRTQALLHGELSEKEAERWARHLETCAACGARLDGARREEHDVFAALHALDTSVSGPTIDAVRAVAAGGSRDTPSGTRQPGPGLRRAWRIAASILILFGAAGVVYALPGSPLRDAVRGWFAGSSASTLPPADSETAMGAGLAVDVADGLLVRFEEPRPGDTLYLRIVEDTLLTARADAPARFTSLPGAISVRSASANRYRLSVPVRATEVRVEAGGRTVAVVRGGRVAVGGLRVEGREVVLPLLP